MSDAALHAVIESYGKELKVPTMLRVYRELARHARDGGWPYEEFVKQMLEAEVRERRDKCVAPADSGSAFSRSEDAGSNRLAGFAGRFPNPRSWNWRVVSISNEAMMW